MKRGLPNSHSLLYICGRKVLVQVDHKLRKLFDVNYILRML